MHPCPPQCDKYGTALAAARASCEVCNGDAAAAKANDGGCEHASVPKSLCQLYIKQKCTSGNNCRDVVQYCSEFSPM